MLLRASALRFATSRVQPASLCTGSYIGSGTPVCVPTCATSFHLNLPYNTTYNHLTNNTTNDDEEMENNEAIDESLHEDNYNLDNEDVYAELYHPVEAFAGVMENAKAIVYALVTSLLMPTASAMHVCLDHEHGRAGIWFSAILAMLLLSLVLVLVYKMGIRNERRRRQEELDVAYQQLDCYQRDLDQLQQDCERYRVMISEFHDQLNNARMDVPTSTLCTVTTR